MVNNSFRAIVRYFALLLVFFSVNGYAQKISKHYTSSLQQNGTLYFIYEQNDFKSKSSDFKYDLTILSTGDSVTFNFSILEKDNVEIDSIQLVKESLQFTSATDRIFIEPKKNLWHGRFTTKFLFTDIQKFYSEGVPKIVLYAKKGNMEFTIKPSAWKDQYELMNRIFQVIRYNK